MRLEGMFFPLRNCWRRATVQSLMSGSVCGGRDGRAVEEGVLRREEYPVFVPEEERVGRG